MLRELALLAAALGISHATDYATSKYSTTYIKTSKVKVKMDLEMNTNDNYVTMTLVGPSDVWFGVGFGNTVMASTYSIIIDGFGEVSERYLIEKTAGNELDLTWEISSNTVSDSDNLRTVILTREYNYNVPSEFHYEFSTSASKLNTIWGYGTSADLDNHGQDKRGSSSLSAKRESVKNYQSRMQKQSAEKELYGAMTEDYMKEEYESYLTTSSVLTWITCIIALCIMGYFGYKKWNANKNYEKIPDNCRSNINMVEIVNEQQQEQIV